MEFLITYLDGRTSTLRVLPVDVVTAERRFKKSFADTDDISVEQMMFLCWRAASRQGEWISEFDKWLEAVADMTPAAPVPLAQPSA